jgi:hypothetical protein
MGATVYVALVSSLLLASDLFHIFAPGLTDRVMGQVFVVRLVGGLLLVLSIPCMFWRSWYWWALLAALGVSGVWRLFFPQSSIRAQQITYPRWVHGCLLLGGAILVWSLKP